MRLKGIRIQRNAKKEYVITPIYFSKGGGEQTLTVLKAVSKDVVSAVAEVVGRLVARGDLKE